MKRKKFTLIELLVVVAIIGILSSLLLPSLSQARKKGKEAVSMSNLKQIYQGVFLYSSDSDEYVPSPTNFVTNKHWPRYIYEAMTGNALGPQPALVVQQMKESSYTGVMYCPIVTDVNGSPTYNGMGRSDYGLNRYFLHTNGGHKKFSVAQLGGEREPMFVPIQNPSNPSIWNTDIGTSAKHAAYFYGKNDKTLSLFIHGNVKFMTTSEGASIDSFRSNGNNFE